MTTVYKFNKNLRKVNRGLSFNKQVPLKRLKYRQIF